MATVGVSMRVQSRSDFLFVCSLFVFMAICAAASVYAQTPPSPKGRTKEMGLTNRPPDRIMLLCEVVGNDTVYLSKVVAWYPSTQNPPQKARDYFGEFITKNYGPAYSPSCVRYPDDPATAEANRQIKLDEYRKMNAHRHPPLRVVEVDWVPPAAPASSVAAAAAPPPAKPAQTTYEQALAAQRPRSVSQEQLKAAAKSPAPASHPNQSNAVPTPTPGASTAERYTFCYSIGSPYRGTAQSHYYVTKVFPAAANAHPDGDFGRYLQQQHPQEDNHAKCVPPGPMSTAERSRSTSIEGQHKSFPNRAIVELTWQPKS
jgi:hypothetical protein